MKQYERVVRYSIPSISSDPNVFIIGILFCVGNGIHKVERFGWTQEVAAYEGPLYHVYHTLIAQPSKHDTGKNIIYYQHKGTVFRESERRKLSRLKAALPALDLSFVATINI